MMVTPPPKTLGGHGVNRLTPQLVGTLRGQRLTGFSRHIIIQVSWLLARVLAPSLQDSSNNRCIIMQAVGCFSRAERQFFFI